MFRNFAPAGGIVSVSEPSTEWETITVTISGARAEKMQSINT